MKRGLLIDGKRKEVVVRTKAKTEEPAKPKDLRDGLARVTLEDHKSVFTPLSATADWLS